MKVLLRKTDAQLYYVGPDQWTSDRELALDCEDVERAMTLSRQARLTNMEVVVSDHDPEQDLSLRFADPPSSESEE